MKLTLQLKLLPDAEQAKQLLATMRAFNAAATFAAKIGWDAKVFSAPSIQKRVYYDLRSRFGLSAQMAVRAIGKAAEVFQRDKSKCPKFRPLGAMTYDQRILSFKDCHKVSILALSGRTLIPFVFGEYQRGRLDRLKGQVDLVTRDGKFYLYATVDLPEDPPVAVSEFLGVDLGIVNILTDSTGERHTGADVERHRRRHLTARRSFQRRGTKSAKRRLKKLAGKQRRYQTHCNHVLSKRIVAKASTLGLGIALEDLKGLRSRCEPKVRRQQRSRLSNWSFAQLRSFLSYKAKLAGVPLVAVDPRNTSRTCFVCGHCDQGNRKSQDRFSCLACGHTAHADCNAARNIGRLGATVSCPDKCPDH